MTSILDTIVVIALDLLQNVVAACLDSQVSLVNVRDNAGYTPLHESCVAGGLHIVERLLVAGADVNAASQDGTR